MDLVIAHPFLHQMGGERVVLEIAKKFNPIIYSVVYEPEKTFPEFKEFDIRILPKSKLEIPFFFLKNDPNGNLAEENKEKSTELNRLTFIPTIFSSALVPLLLTVITITSFSNVRKLPAKMIDVVFDTPLDSEGKNERPEEFS